jgi:DivIVA domain-containing protein
MELASTDIENKTFDVVRKGYDREQVALFLEKVGDAMSRTDERRKIAEVRAEQLEREFHDLKTRADSTIKETVAARVRLLDTKAGDAPAAGIKPSSTVLVNQARIEAQQIIEQANVRATAMQAEAEAVIEGALASSAKINQERSDLLGSTEAERTGLIAAATEQAAAIRDEATQVVEIARADAAGYAAEVRHKAEADADRMTIEARTRAREITANAELQRDDLVARRRGVRGPLATSPGLRTFRTSETMPRR